MNADFSPPSLKVAVLGKLSARKETALVNAYPTDNLTSTWWPLRDLIKKGQDEEMKQTFNRIAGIATAKEKVIKFVSEYSVLRLAASDNVLTRGILTLLAGTVRCFADALRLPQ